MITLWKSLILPVLEYGSQLWCPSKRKDIESIEALQRTFTSRIADMQELSYWERLQYLQLYSLQRRRERYLIIYLWKIIEGKVPNIRLREGNISTKTSERRGRMCELRKIQTKASEKIKTLVDANFAVRAAKLFNALPRAIRNTTGVSTETFKKRLDAFLRALPDKPPVAGYPRSMDNTIEAAASRRGYTGKPGD